MSNIAPDVRQSTPLTDDRGLVVRPIGSSTEETSIAIRELTTVMRAILNYLNKPLWVEPLQSRVKTDTSVVGGTLATVTTLNQLSGFTTSSMTTDLARQNWVLNVRNRIT